MIRMPTTAIERPTTAIKIKNPCMVLSVVSVGDEQWIDYRGRRFGTWLRERGISHGWAENGEAEELIAEARARKVRVIISEAQVIHVDVVEKLATALPGVKIIHLLHGAPAWCASYAPAQTYGAIRQSRDLPNVWVAAVSNISAMAWTKGSKVIQLPNPIQLPSELAELQPKARPTAGEVLCVSLIARPFPAKNWGGMLAALGILAERRPIRVICAGRNTPWQREHLNYLEALEIPVENMMFGDWSLSLNRVASYVHVGLACGFTDALNLIAAEHCLLGIPVVGSPSLDWMPPEWRINPQDPVAMADLVERHASDEVAGGVGRDIVKAMAIENEELLLRNLTLLIEE